MRADGIRDRRGIGLSRRAVQEWVRRYNREGLAGLETRAGQGREPILSESERQLVAERVEAGPQKGEVCSLRGVRKRSGVIRDILGTVCDVVGHHGRIDCETNA